VTNERAARLGAAFATLWLLALMVVDVLVPPSVIPDPLFAIAPLFAAAVMSARATAGFAAASVVLVVLSGFYNDTWGHAQQWILLLDVVLVGGAAVAIAEVRILREKRFARMSNIADVAQRALLPLLPRHAADVSVAASYPSAAAGAVVRGDLYDCSLVGGHVRCLIGDVRGKGIVAVEQAARVIRAFRQAAALEETPPAVVADVDAYLIPFLGDEDFVTACLADVSQPDRLQLVSCGHPLPLLIHDDGTADFVTLPYGLPLGLGGVHEGKTVYWRAGDRLLLYTDGLSEARNDDGEFFPLIDHAKTLASSTPDEALKSLLENVRLHVRGGQLEDDLAVILLENRPSTEQSPADGG